MFLMWDFKVNALTAEMDSSIETDKGASNFVFENELCERAFFHVAFGYI